MSTSICSGCSADGGIKRTVGKTLRFIPEKGRIDEVTMTTSVAAYDERNADGATRIGSPKSVDHTVPKSFLNQKGMTVPQQQVILSTNQSRSLAALSDESFRRHTNPCRRPPEVSVTEEAIRNIQKQQQQKQNVTTMDTSRQGIDAVHPSSSYNNATAIPKESMVVLVPQRFRQEVHMQHHVTLLNQRHQDECNNMMTSYNQNQMILEQQQLSSAALSQPYDYQSKVALQQQQSNYTQSPFHLHPPSNAQHCNDIDTLYYGDVYNQHIIAVAASQGNHNYILPKQQSRRRRRRRSAPKQENSSSPSINSNQKNLPLDEKLQNLYDQSMIKKKRHLDHKSNTSDSWEVAVKALVAKSSLVDKDRQLKESKGESNDDTNEGINATTTQNVRRAIGVAAINTTATSKSSNYPATKRRRASRDCPESEKMLQNQSDVAHVLSRLSSNDIAKAVQCIIIPPPPQQKRNRHKPILVLPQRQTPQQREIRFKPIQPKTTPLPSLQHTTRTSTSQTIIPGSSAASRIEQIPTLTPIELNPMTTTVTHQAKQNKNTRSKGLPPTRHVAVVSPPNCGPSLLSSEDQEKGSFTIPLIQVSTTITRCDSGSSDSMTSTSPNCGPSLLSSEDQEKGSFTIPLMQDSTTITSCDSGSSALMTSTSNSSNFPKEELGMTDWISTTKIETEKESNIYMPNIDNGYVHEDVRFSDLLSMEEILSLSDSIHSRNSSSNLSLDDTELMHDAYLGGQIWDDNDDFLQHQPHPQQYP